jgi:hypothetical protein
MSRRRQPMAAMAGENDIEGITHLLDEGVDPAAREERVFSVRVIMMICVSRALGPFV